MNNFYNIFIKWFQELQKRDKATYNFSLSATSAKVYKVTQLGRKTLYFVDMKTGNIYNTTKHRLGNIEIKRS